MHQASLSGFTQQDRDFVASMRPDVRARFMEIVANGGVRGGEDDPPSDPPADPPADDGPSEAEKALAAANEQNAALAKKVAAANDRDRKQAEADKRTKAAEEGKLKDLSEAQAAQLEAATAQNEKLMKTLQGRAEKQLEGLPKEQQEKLAGFKDRVDIDVWLEMVEDATASAGPAAAADPADPDAPPPAGGGTGADVPKKGEHKPTARAEKFLNDMMRPGAIEQLKRLSVERDSESNAYKFVKPVKTFFGDMNTIKSHNLNLADAAKR